MTKTVEVEVKVRKRAPGGGRKFKGALCKKVQVFIGIEPRIMFRITGEVELYRAIQAMKRILKEHVEQVNQAI